MNDRQLHELLRMAAEVEAIEAQSSSSLGQVSPWTVANRPAARRRVAWAVASAAAMFTLAAGVFVSLRPAPTPSATTLADASKPAPVEPVLEPAPADMQPAVLAVDSKPASPGMLLAIYQDILGAARCVQILPLPIEPGSSLADVARADLLHVDELGENSRCATGGPQRLLVVALAGPATALPDSDASAQALASCIAASRDQCSELPSSYADAAAACVPPGVSVRVESTLVLR